MGKKHASHRKRKSSLDDDDEQQLEQLRQNLNTLGLSKKPKEPVKNMGIASLLNQFLAARNTTQFCTAIGKYLISKNPRFFRKLHAALVSADYDIVSEIYIGKMFFTSLFVFILSSVFVLSIMLLDMPWFNPLHIIFPFISSISVFFLLYIVPIEKVSSKRRSIDTNLPFALTHLSAIASSGTPPEEAFRIMSSFSEFGSVGVETKNIVKRIDVFGEDITTALKQVISTTPSESFREILGGILTITQTGGHLNAYLSEMADIAMFDYKLAREKHISALSTYADIYTAILIAAPLILVSVLVVMNIVPNTTLPGNISIMDALSIGVYGLIPGMNILFLAFITFTTPEM